MSQTRRNFMITVALLTSPVAKAGRPKLPPVPPLPPPKPPEPPPKHDPPTGDVR